MGTSPPPTSSSINSMATRIRARGAGWGRGRVLLEGGLGDDGGDHAEGIVFHQLGGFEVVPVLVLGGEGGALVVARPGGCALLPAERLDPLVRQVVAVVLQRQRRAMRERAEPRRHIVQVRLDLDIALAAAAISSAARLGGRVGRNLSREGFGSKTADDGGGASARRRHPRLFAGAPRRARARHGAASGPTPCPDPPATRGRLIGAHAQTRVLAQAVPRSSRRRPRVAGLGPSLARASAEVAADARERILTDGFASVPASRLPWRSVNHRALAAAATLMQHGWNPSWPHVRRGVGGGARALGLVEAATGNRLNFDALCWHVDPRDARPTAFSPHRDRQPDDSPATFRPTARPCTPPRGCPSPTPTPRTRVHFIPRDADLGTTTATTTTRRRRRPASALPPEQGSLPAHHRRPSGDGLGGALHPPRHTLGRGRGAGREFLPEDRGRECAFSLWLPTTRSSPRTSIERITFRSHPSVDARR